MTVRVVASGCLAAGRYAPATTGPNAATSFHLALRRMRHLPDDTSDLILLIYRTRVRVVPNGCRMETQSPTHG